MPSTANDALSEASPTSGQTKNETQSSHPANAAGAEIPVTLHASRYSAAAKGVGKLPPVHEETRTVIIFPQGAVVRLAATVTPGELVVLTNNRTGTDVICRVTSVKTQPGIQNYVHLEFTQRALDFWEESSATERGNSVGKPPVVAASPAPAPPAPVAPGNTTPSSPLQAAQPTTKTSLQAAEVKSVPAPMPKVTPLADLPASGSHPSSSGVSAGQSQASEITASPAFAHKQAAQVVPPRIPRLQPFEGVIPQKKSASKTIVLFAMTAAVLVAIGAVGGPELLRRYGMVAAPPLSDPSVALTPEPPTVSEHAASGSQAPIVNTSGAASPVEPVVSTAAKHFVAESPLAQPAAIPPAAELSAAPKAPKVEVPPQPVTRTTVNVGKISAPKVKTAARLNPSEPPPVLPADASALPAGISESVINATARVNPLLPAAPAPPAPAAGGQLQQPKLLSSVAAVYPTLARTQRVQGDVTIDALIDATGKVAATNVISGNPLLQKAAIDALRLWKYQPARLNGEPIPVRLNVTIVFHLQ